MYLSRRLASQYRYRQPDGIPLELLANAQLLQERLEQWNSAFNYSYSCQKAQGDPRMSPQVCLLLIHYHMAVITASTCLYAEEMIYDRLLPNFDCMIRLADKLVSWWHSQPAGNTLGVPVDMGVVQPLYMIATKCRTTSLRQKAICMLLAMPNNKGVWEGPIVASVAQRAKDIEELGLDVEIDGVPEFRRIHSIGFEVAQGTDRVHVEFRRRPNGMDGEWEWWKECLSY